MSGRRSKRLKSRARSATSVSADSPISRIAQNVPGQPPVAPVRLQAGQMLAKQTHFQGPIPHPEIFAQYGEVIPDAPERILRVFEEDSKHARDIQKLALEAQKEDNHRVHWMAWSLIAGGYVLSGLFAWFGKDVLAGLLLTGTLAGTITGFIQNRSPSSSRATEKK